MERLKLAAVCLLLTLKINNVQSMTSSFIVFLKPQESKCIYEYFPDNTLGEQPSYFKL